jgi:biotin carboxyl carrier protein
MHGRVVAVSVKPGDRVSPGSEVCILEAMKMEQSIRVSGEGVVKEVHIKPGQQVASGDILVELE